MPSVVFDRSDEVIDWVAERSPGEGRFLSAVGLGVVTDGGELIGGAVYSNWLKPYGTICIHYAADKPIWARPHVLRDVFGYAFHTCGVYRVWCAVELQNTHSQKTVEHMGFKREATLHSMFGPQRHGIISRLLKPDFDRLYGEKA